MQDLNSTPGELLPVYSQPLRKMRVQSSVTEASPQDLQMVPPPYKKYPTTYSNPHLKETPTHICIFPQNFLPSSPTKQLDD